MENVNNNSVQAPPRRAMRTCTIAAAAAALCAALFACARPAAPAVHADGAGAPSSARGAGGDSMAAVENGFGFRLFDRLAAKSTGQNIFISPTSLALALGLTYNGATRGTEQAMAKALGLSGLSLDQINKGNAALVADLAQPEPGVRLDIANSLWVKDLSHVAPGFLQSAREQYKAEVGSLQGAPATINAWVSSKTEGKITRVVQQSDMASIRLILVNAVYFKGAWQQPFSRALTKDGPFTLADGKAVTCPMMSQSGEYSYFQGDGFQALRLPYGKGRMQMTILLPTRPAGLSALLPSLTVDNWAQWRAKFHTARGNIKLPRFRTEYEGEMKEPLTALGMGIAFDAAHGTFDRIYKNLYLGWVKHKTYLAVDEEGTEAAAATSVGIRTRAMRREETFTMEMDHPFLCAIENSQTGALVFLGAIVNPS